MIRPVQLDERWEGHGRSRGGGVARELAQSSERCVCPSIARRRDRWGSKPWRRGGSSGMRAPVSRSPRGTATATATARQRRDRIECEAEGVVDVWLCSSAGRIAAGKMTPCDGWQGKWLPFTRHVQVYRRGIRGQQSTRGGGLSSRVRMRVRLARLILWPGSAQWRVNTGNTGCAPRPGPAGFMRPRLRPGRRTSRVIAPPPFPRGPNVVGRFGGVEHGGRGVYEGPERVEGWERREREDWERRHGGGDARGGQVRSQRLSAARLMRSAVAMLDVESMALSVLNRYWAIAAWELVEGGRGVAWCGEGNSVLPSRQVRMS